MPSPLLARRFAPGPAGRRIGLWPFPSAASRRRGRGFAPHRSFVSARFARSTQDHSAAWAASFATAPPGPDLAPLGWRRVRAAAGDGGFAACPCPPARHGGRSRCSRAMSAAAPHCLRLACASAAATSAGRYAPRPTSPCLLAPPLRLRPGRRVAAGLGLPRCAPAASGVRQVASLPGRTTILAGLPARSHWAASRAAPAAVLPVTSARLWQTTHTSPLVRSGHPIALPPLACGGPRPGGEPPCINSRQPARACGISLTAMRPAVFRALEVPAVTP